MANVLTLKFEDFKNLVDGKRIYYYEGEDFIDFHIIHNSIIVKSKVMKSEVENPEKFFSNQMFVGAMSLQFNIPVEKVNKIEKPVSSGVSEITFRNMFNQKVEGSA